MTICSLQNRGLCHRLDLQSSLLQHVIMEYGRKRRWLATGPFNPAKIPDVSAPLNYA